MDEIPLAGGNTHDGVVRVGETVRRPAGAWTPAVHALLRHLASRGADVPLPRGLDERGREVLDYIPGVVVWPDHAELMRDDAFLVAVAEHIRRLHDAVADFVPPADASWMPLAPDPVGPAEIVCHNDLGPWNLVVGADGRLTFIDWDPLLPSDPEPDDERIVTRLRAFIGGYGRGDFPSDALDVAIERCRIEADRIERTGGRLLEEGHAEIWRAGHARVAEKRERWQRAFD
jgi:hypothetical protein